MWERGRGARERGRRGRSATDKWVMQGCSLSLSLALSLSQRHTGLREDEESHDVSGGEEEEEPRIW